MRLLKWGFAIVLILLFPPIKAQVAEISKFYEEGLIYEENKEYEKAIIAFKRVLTFDKKNSNAMHELAFCYLELGFPDWAIEFSSTVIKKKDDNLLGAYLIYASALELKGKTKTSIKAYHKALKEFPNNSLLCYNLALTYLNNSQFEKAEEYAIKSIELDKSHTSSHLLLAHIMYAQGERVKTMLALYYFLLIEQDTERSLIAYDMLSELWQQGLNPKGARQLFLANSGIDNNDFGAIELALLKNDDQENDELEEAESEESLLLHQFVNNTQVLFKTLDKNKKSNGDFWWEFYSDMFSKAHQLEVTEALGYYVSNCKYKALVLVWLSDNFKKFDTFNNWMYLQ